MRLGPVLERELLVTARRGRFFVLRFLYGLALFALVVTACRGAGGVPVGTATISPTHLVPSARGLFLALVFLQWLAVIVLTPALVSGAIAGEYQRKTLHDLLTSDLSDAEIILGKLSARLI